MSSSQIMRSLLLTACALTLPAQNAAEPRDAVSKEATPNGIVGQLTVTQGKSLILDSNLAIQRLPAADGSLVEVQAISPKEVLLNGKAPGQTSLTIWREDGTRLVYDLTVRVSPRKISPETNKPGEGK